VAAAGQRAAGARRSASAPWQGAAASAGTLAYLARQPIFDKRGAVVAYELLQRTAPGTAFDPDDERVTLAVTAKALLEFGLDRLVGPALAYVNTPAGFLTSQTYRLLPAERTVLEVLERAQVDGALVAAAQLARSEGYRLALDDYQGNPAFDPLLGHVDVVKVDLAGLTRAALRSVFERVRHRAPQATILAEKVETAAEHSLVRSLGAQLYQGFYFAKPTTLTTKEVPAHAPVLLQLAGALDGSDLDLHRVARVVAHEPRVSYRLLRLVNAASVGLTRSIDSVERAVTMIGAEQLRRLVLLLLVTTDAKGPDEIVNLAVLRAKMAETLAPHYGCEPAAAFTTGMLSMLDVAFGMPMHALLAELPLNDTIRDALVHGSGDLGALLADVESYERGPDISRPELAGAFVGAYATAATMANELRQTLGAR
jgi:EAL and modified HD-GYP domain-containing signal transduction protein